ncbi:MAG: 50S ribosomal protein L6 [Candidatus Margulisiibacteriota bacterium]
MGRIGKRLLEIPQGVTVKVVDGTIQIKGPKGSLTQEYLPAVRIEVLDNKVQTFCASKDPRILALQGLYNSLVKNMIEGVTSGFEKKLEMVGVGYRATKQGKGLHILIGYSHPVIVEPPDGIELAVEGTNKISVKGIDKQLVGEIAAEIRSIREVEPYKGKGIRYAGEKVRKKAGKAAKAAAGV